ncbi:hypothetical protein NDU88_003101 [Pleurodeles waltl]|uniref:Uncharacterized protein n=1 Tax=Pleurodeles waltl TaxID=8319 RepID=A0AAV7LE98_PLEWA|nr:hypothetical protein NDU88_003101 [Pleurodeles waltl]
MLVSSFSRKEWKSLRKNMAQMLGGLHGALEPQKKEIKRQTHEGARVVAEVMTQRQQQPGACATDQEEVTSSWDRLQKFGFRTSSFHAANTVLRVMYGGSAYFRPVA